MFKRVSTHLSREIEPLLWSEAHVLLDDAGSIRSNCREHLRLHPHACFTSNTKQNPACAMMAGRRFQQLRDL